MELGLGQRYTIGIDNISVVASGSAATSDIIQFAPASNVPLLLEHAFITANATTAAILRAQIVFRSSASTGGTTVTPKNMSPAGPAASCTLTYNNTTTGTLVANSSSEAQQWNEFAPYEYDVRPTGLLCIPTQFLCIFIPASPAASVPVSIRLEFTEVK